MKDLYILIFLPKYTEAPSKHAPDVLSLGYHADETGSSLIISDHYVYTLGLCGI